MRRAAPAVALFFIAPLVAEFLLGDLPISFLGTLVILASRAFGNQRLSQPNRNGNAPDRVERQHENRPPDSNPEPWEYKQDVTAWLGSVGVTITAVLFALAAIASANYAIKSDKQHFIASAPQFTWAGIACALVIVIAFLLPKPRARRASGFVPSPWVVGLAALAAGSFFLVVPKGWGWNAVVIYLALDVIVVAAFGRWSRRLNWNDFHRLALAGGAGLAYAWHAFIQNPAAGQAGKVDRIGNAVFAVGLIAVLLIAANRISRAFTEQGIAAGSPAS